MLIQWSNSWITMFLKKIDHWHLQYPRMSFWKLPLWMRAHPGLFWATNEPLLNVETVWVYGRMMIFGLLLSKCVIVEYSFWHSVNFENGVIALFACLSATGLLPIMAVMLAFMPLWWWHADWLRWLLSWLPKVIAQLIGKIGGWNWGCGSPIWQGLWPHTCVLFERLLSLHMCCVPILEFF